VKNYKTGIVIGIISIISTLLIIGVPIGDKKVAIGFLPGMILSIIGLILTNKNKENKKVKTSFILNTIALIMSIISLIMSIMNGFIIDA